MQRQPLVILDDYFVKEGLLSALLQSDAANLDIPWAAKGDYFEIPSGDPFIKELFSSTHTALRQWTRTDDVRITYSSWLYNIHLGIVATVAARFIAGITSAPLVQSLGAMSNICLSLILSYHMVFFVALNYQPIWFEKTVIFHSPFAWAAIWLLVFFGDSQETSGAAAAVAFPSPIRGLLDRRVGPLALLLMHVFVWYMRRTVIGIAVFERKIRAASWAHWFHRIYSVLAALFIVLAWRCYPYVFAYWGRHTLLAGDNVAGQKMLREWLDDREEISILRLIATMMVSGGIHALWYSFISYAYHMVMWREYMREGLAVWAVGDSVMCTKLH
ncbi:hypothetical protein H4S08_000237 [Coemansia sp. RSA 1365]|nr:hypothetical protein H4S08_000237 [Coemansia sp. RSA 1365]